MPLSTPNSDKRKEPGLVEYSLILIIVSIVIIAFLAILQPKLEQKWHRGSYFMSGKVIDITTMFREPYFTIKVESVTTDKTGYLPYLVDLGKPASFYSSDKLNWNSSYALSCIQVGRVNRCNLRKEGEK